MIAVVVALGAALAAQADGWAPVTAGPMASLTAPLTPPGRLTLQPIALASAVRGAYDEAGAWSEVPLGVTTTTTTTTQLFVEVSPLEWLAFGGQPQLIASSETRGADSVPLGVGDTQLFARIAWWARSGPKHPLATALAMLTVPTGDVDDGFGSGAFVATTGTSFTLYAKPVVWHADALVTLPFPGPEGRTQRPALVWTLAAEIPVAFVANRTALLVELGGRHQADVQLFQGGGAGPPEHELVLGVGVELIASDDLQGLVGWQRTLWGRNVDAVDTLVVTLVPLL